MEADGVHAGPTTADDDVRGARLLAPPRGRRVGSANALSFRGGDDAILFGSGEGLGIAFAATGLARLASRALVVALHPLEPAPIVLAEVLRLDQTRRQDLTPPDTPFGRDPEGAAAPPGQLPYGMGGRESRRLAEVEPSRYLLFATATGVRVIPAGTLGTRDRRTASGGTVWWAEVRQVLALEDAIGMVGSNEALPVLQQMIDRKSLFGIGKKDETKPGVANALAMIGTPEARAILEKGANSKEE